MPVPDGDRRPGFGGSGGGGRWWGQRWGGGNRRADDDDARPAGDALGEVRPGPELPGMEDFGDDANRRV
jgi:hypothetical protein